MGRAFVLLLLLAAEAAAMCNESLACPCEDRIFANGFAALCHEGRCVNVTLPGDLCGVDTPPCIVKDGCVGGACQPLQQGAACDLLQQCGVDAHCVNRTCVPLPYLGEKCENVCQQSSFCNKLANPPACTPLFLKQPGTVCADDNECVPSALCVNGTCATAVSRCRYELRDAFLCAGRAGCFFGSSNASFSCAMQRQCFYETATLRNCLYNETCGLYLDPGLPTLTKVGISVALVCAALLGASLVIYVIQRRRAAALSYSRLQ
jgi:hypothetical protein